MTSLHSVAISKLFMAQNQRSKSQQRQVHADLFFSTAKALSTSNSYPLVKPSMASFTVRFWSGWVRAVGSNFQTSGRTTIGFSAMTTRPLTHQFLFDNSWLPKTLQWFPNPTPLFAWPRPLRLFSIPQDEITVERAPSWHDWGDAPRIARGYRHTHISELPGMHEIMENMLGSLYTCPRDYFERSGGKQGLQTENFFCQISGFFG